MNLNYYLVDVFTNRQFGGNPLAVFPEADSVTSEQMQSIASELNLSETTFIQKGTSEGSDCTVRIFTPKSEVPMAGHPTIGTAWTILKQKILTPRQSDHLLFDEGVGPVRVDYQLSPSGPEAIVMHQPLPEFFQTVDRSVAAEVLSLSPDDIAESSPAQIVSCGFPLLIVPLKTLDAAGRSRIRLDLVDHRLSETSTREVLVFTSETVSDDADVHCRFFAPRFGVPEDPATGGAHGPLGSYMVNYKLNDGKRIISEQGVEMGRPSTIRVSIESTNGDIKDVQVGGDCVEIGSGTICIDNQSQE